MAFDSFLGWIKTLVYQLFGKRELECQCQERKDPQIDIVILAVNSDRPSHQAPSWQDFENLLFESVNPESDLAKDFITGLRDKILGARGFGPASNTLRCFQDIIGGNTIISSLHMHCEAILKAASMYHDQVSEDNLKLVDVCKVPYPTLFIFMC
jgi:hypothetical protein